MGASRSPAATSTSTPGGRAPPRGRARPPGASQALRHGKVARLAQGAVEIDGTQAKRLQAAIGRAVRRHRQALNLTVADLAKRSGRSLGTLSKIENGIAAPSVDTLGALARALGVPVAAFFKESAQQHEAVFVPAGQGLSGRGRRSWDRPQHRLIGQAPEQRCVVGLYLITLKRVADLPPTVQHTGFASLHMLEGEVRYRYGDRLYRLRRGDSLSFDTDAPHGPVAIVRLPVRLLSVICDARDD